MSSNFLNDVNNFVDMMNKKYGISLSNAIVSEIVKLEPEAEKTAVALDEALIIYTDGACKGNPGKAGAGIAFDDQRFDDFGVYISEHATNNIAEILAPAFALEAVALKVNTETTRVQIVTDSRLVTETYNAGWKKKTNKEHWNRLDSIKDQFLAVEFVWVKGHNAHEGNDRADKLASDACYNPNSLPPVIFGK